MAGAYYSRKIGLGRASFPARIPDQFTGYTVDDESMQDMAGFGSIAAAKARGLVKEE
ncbi:MAG TPA: hypothetical protein PK481_03980 [Bacillota bacterium]|nr:hypothetical protein [Bacillota bacterium]